MARLSSIRFLTFGFVTLALVAGLGARFFQKSERFEVSQYAHESETPPAVIAAPSLRHTGPGNKVAPEGVFRSSNSSDVATATVGSDRPLLTEIEQVEQYFGATQKNGIWIPLEDEENPGGTGNLTGTGGTVRTDGSGNALSGGGPLIYITTGTLPLGRVAEKYSTNLDAVGGSEPYRWSLKEGSLPAGLELDKATGVLSGTPENSSTTALRIEVADANGQSDIAGFDLVIEPEDALTIITEHLPSARPGEPYSLILAATGGRPPYEWSATGDWASLGTLTLDPVSGQLSGQIDPAAEGKEGLLAIQVQDDQIAVSKNFILAVDGDPDSALEILTTTLPDGRTDEEYSVTLQADGGSPPYAWLTEASLPEGLTFSSSGVLSGTPEEGGTFEIGFQVQDSAGDETSATLSLRLKSEMEGITDLSAFRSLRRVALNWTYPPDRGNAEAIIVRTVGAPASEPSEGVLVYSGSDNSMIDSGLDPATYHYAAFLAGEDPELVAPAHIEVTLPQNANPFADSVLQTALLHPQSYNSVLLPGVATGPPQGEGLSRGSIDVVSLGAATNDDGSSAVPYGGSILLEFTDNVIWNGPGLDFTVFENVFYILDQNGQLDPDSRFMEPAVVSVSQDGATFFTFPFDFSPRYDGSTGELNLRHPFVYNRGFAGVNPVLSNGFNPDPTDPALSGGDSFDLAELGLEWVRFVRIQSTGHLWLTDENGDKVHHIQESGAATRNFNKSGFDLDGASAIWLERISPAP